MTNNYHKEEKKSRDPLDPQEVFRIHHNDIPRGITQCQKHSWVKLNDREIKCTKCPTALIVTEDYLKELIKNNAS